MEVERGLQLWREDTQLQKIWHGMLYRCNNPKSNSYKNYGGRGIKVCDRWKDFENFCTDMYDSYYEHVSLYGKFDTTIERIDVNGNYCPENCKWVTREEQCWNKQNTIRLDNGQSLAEYCVKNGLNYEKIVYKIRNGYTPQEAIDEVFEELTQNFYQFRSKLKNRSH